MSRRKSPRGTTKRYLARTIRDRVSSGGMKVIRLASWMRAGKMK